MHWTWSPKCSKSVIRVNSSRMGYQEQISCLFDQDDEDSEASLSISAAVLPWRVVQDHRTLCGTLQFTDLLTSTILFYNPNQRYILLHSS